MDDFTSLPDGTADITGCYLFISWLAVAYAKHLLVGLGGFLSSVSTMLLMCALCRYAIGYYPGASGGWFIFFAIQGPILAVESELKRWARKNKLELPRSIAVPLTLVILLTLGNFFFFQPPMHSGLADRVVNSLMQSYEAMWTAGREMLGH